MKEEMTKLSKYFIGNKLAPRRIEDLRKHLSEQSDEALGDELQELWEQYTGEEPMSDDAVERLKARIDREISASEDPAEAPASSSPILGRKALLWMAAALIPVLLLLNVYLWISRPSTSHGQMVAVSTQQGERSTVTLPDGSTVILGESSSLSYSPDLYREDSREVSFKGEGYFDIESDARRPFIIREGDLSVQVLGTAFNLRARDEEPFVRVDLERGAVALSIEGQSKATRLHPNESATYDKKQKTIALRAISDMKSVKAWVNKEIIFSDTPLSEVVSRLEEQYAVQISYSKSRGEDLFTGVLPANNLSEAMEVVRKAMDVPLTLK